MRWIGSNLAEVRRDPALRWYGAGLGVAGVLTYAWFVQFSAADLLAQTETAICWPFFESCHRWRVLPRAAVHGVLFVHCALSAAAAGLFLWRRTVPKAWWLLFAAEVLAIAIVAQDFRLRLNQHYMLAWVVFAFLFVPNKRRVLRLLVTSFYFFAGLLKLNADWLSGATLPVPVEPFAGPWLAAACIYVVVLELALVWGVFARSAFVFWGTLAQLALFHLMSWQVVGFFYPLLMFALLSIHVLDRLVECRARRSSRHGLALLGVFAALQAVPYLFPGDTAITGEGRLFSLHMFDARVTCEAYVEVDGRRQSLVSRLSPRINCDPIVFLNRARMFCGRVGDRRMGLYVSSRREGEDVLRPVVAIEDFCHADIEYDLWRANAWILHR